ncbi:Soluble cell wall 10 [Hyphodiscus hymeniophilus]|uniref:Soluble cell wall 10 n=1 Tax=Hyphodiscus hymeniophilus TaxID=353542 RepID=A0A9P6VG56_9HELO|nr:Soluble cell wall 10 [Hyphodiscus hymeniophilus]
MKTTTFIAAFGLATLAVAQPHRARHLNKHAKKDVVVTIIDTVYAEATAAPEVIVYVNQFGTPVSTVTEGMIAETPSIWSSAVPSTILPSSSSTSTSVVPSSTPTAAPVVAAPVVAAPVQASSVEAAPVEAVAESSSSPAPASTAAPVTTSAAPVASSSASSSSDSEGSGFGFSYSPYNADGSCKTQDQVNTDFAAIPGGYSLVRTYGTDCNQVATVKTAAKAKGLKMFVGVFDLGTLSDEISTIVSAASDDWDLIDTINIGNELVNSGTASAAQVVAAITTAKVLLKAAGYNGKVVTVDTLVAARNNPSLCDASDYCAVNSHPFFDGNTVAADSGSFLTTQIPTLRAVLANKNQEIVITETGWPWQGQTNGVAVPSPANQATAISSIKSAFSSNPEAVILFTTFNDMWKTNSAAQFQAEQYWGFLGNSPSG